MKVSIDLSRVRANALAILESTGVPIIAVVKANAYGLGASQVAGAIGDLVHSFYVFDADEAVTCRLWDITGKRTIALNGRWNDPADYLSQHITPVVWTTDRATALRPTRPVLCIDTGQQRFACPVNETDAVRKAGDCCEAMTHAVTLSQVERFRQITDQWKDGELFLHAAGSALLNQPSACLNAVRPGLALYQGAVRLTARLVDARDSTGPAGYTGFVVKRFGVLLAGYLHGLRAGPCLLNGKSTRIQEVGMQSCFVEINPGDRIGDEVILLGDETDINLSAVAAAWGSSQQEVLVRLTRLAERKYDTK